MKLTPAQQRVLAKTQRPGYRFSIAWPPGHVPEPYEPPHYLAGKPFGASLGREKTWNTTLKRTPRK